MTKFDADLAAVAVAWNGIPEAVRLEVSEKLTTAAVLGAEAFGALAPHLEALQTAAAPVFKVVAPKLLLSSDRGAAIEQLSERLGQHFPTLGAVLAHVTSSAPALPPVAVE